MAHPTTHIPHEFDVAGDVCVRCGLTMYELQSSKLYISCTERQRKETDHRLDAIHYATRAMVGATTSDYTPAFSKADIDAAIRAVKEASRPNDRRNNLLLLT